MSRNAFNQIVRDEARDEDLREIGRKERLRAQIERNAELHRDLLAAQAREKVLRGALAEEANIYMENDAEDGPPDHITSALFMPADDTALRAALANERFRIADWFYREGYLVKARDVPNAIRALGDE